MEEVNLFQKLQLIISLGVEIKSLVILGEYVSNSFRPTKKFGKRKHLTEKVKPKNLLKLLH